MRRRPGQLLPLEVEILSEAAARIGTAEPEFHGFAMAKALADHDGSRRLTGHGTMYKALGRLEDAGALESRWEPGDAPETEGRPRRRLYRITVAGQAALAKAVAEASGGQVSSLRPTLESP